MTTQELSLAAAQDEVAYYEQAIDGCDRKIVKLDTQIKKTRAARAQFAKALKESKDAVKAAAKRDNGANAGTAEANGSV